MLLTLNITGIILCILAWIHVIFPRYFHWKTELQSLSLINREMMWVHTFFVALVVFLMGLLCVLEADALCNSPLGHRLCQGMAIFWFCRLLIQFWGYSPALWRGKLFETSVHIVFSLFWIYLSGLFGWIGFIV